MCNVVLACIAYYSYVVHGCVSVCKRWHYIINYVRQHVTHPPTHMHTP